MITKRWDLITITLYWTLGIILFGGIITMISLLALYVNYPVEQTEYAVGYDTFNMKFTKIYEQGRYPIGVGEEMIKIPRTLQDFNREIYCLTKDKILIDLDVGIQYLYIKDDIITKILKEFANIDSFNSFLSDRITSSIINSCLVYESEEYYVERSIIDRHIYNNLLSDINNKSIGVSIEFFQLVNVGFPTEISNAITQKQNIEQESLTAQNDRNTLLTQENTKLLETQRQANILLINANNQANITLNQANTNALAQNTLWTNRAFTYANVANKLNLNSSLLIEYLQTDLISKSDNLFSNLEL
jgi:regulator of protease activity HflC (stomatin/prohibitin superfamily)